VPAGLEGLAAAVAELAACDPDEHGDAALAAQVLALRRLADQLDGAWLRLLAAVDARGAAGAEHGVAALSTAGWLRATLRMSPAGAGRAVRTARTLHRGPLKRTARAPARGQVSAEHAVVLAETTAELPAAQVAEAEGVLVAAAGRLDPPRCAGSPATCAASWTPTGPSSMTGRAGSGGGCGCRPPSTGWWRWMGCWTRRRRDGPLGVAAAGPAGRPRRRSPTVAGWPAGCTAR
jgi:hypothetical protein